MNNSDVKPFPIIEIIEPAAFNKALDALSGIRTPSNYLFYDNSTLDSARTCLRFFYFKHIRKWIPVGAKPALIFGSAWHSAMDFFWPAASASLPKKDVLEGAFENFSKYWLSTDIVLQDEMDLYPRTPTKALELLALYYELYGEDLQRYEIIEVEKPFIIPLTNDDEQKLFYIGKLDKVTRERRTEEIDIWDHKSSSLLGLNWSNSFSPNSQMNGYHHAGRTEFGKAFSNIIIDGVQVHKTKNDFKRLLLSRAVPQIEAWLWETLERIAEIKYNEELLLSYRDSEKHLNFLPAFPKNTKMCAFQYGKACPYRDLCVFQNNPEDHDLCEDSFALDDWSPFLIKEKNTKDGLVFDVTSSEGE